jgi:hypothetical protein
MKRFVTAVLIIGALIMAGGAFASGNTAGAKLEKAVVQFEDQVKVLGVMLKGNYLFVHDEERMARGEDCTYVYNYAGGKQGGLVVSFHCVPVERERAADRFTVTVTMQPGTSLLELVEYRFAGSAEGHKVPQAK